MRDKFGWYDSHKKQVASLRHSDASVLLIGDSIIAGLQRYRNVWRNYFKHQYESLNFGIGGDKVQDVLWRINDLSLPKSLKYAVVQAGTNNLDQDNPKDIANGIIASALAFSKKSKNF